MPNQTKPSQKLSISLGIQIFVIFPGIIGEKSSLYSYQTQFLKIKPNCTVYQNTEFLPVMLDRTGTFTEFLPRKKGDLLFSSCFRHYSIAVQCSAILNVPKATVKIFLMADNLGGKSF
jgi:hypothetical protein